MRKKYVFSGLSLSLSIFDKKRLSIAQQIMDRKKEEMGNHLRAFACYGSVAHKASSEYSDVEMLALTDETVQAKDEQFFEL
jgi:predicted nucleotidyltransferase